jgi:hypothetical protein
LADRLAPAVVWNGGALFVWGGLEPGGGPAAEGAEYNPRTDVWTKLPEAPIGGRRSAITALTNEGVVVWGGCGSLNTQCFSPSDGAVYGATDPKAANFAWRKLPSSPVVATRGETGTEAGENLVIWSSKGAAAYNATANLWRQLSPPVGDRDDALTATDGRRAFFYGGSGADNARTGAVYDPVTDRWSTIPPSPVDARALSWAGRELIAVGSRVAAGYDPDARAWRSLPPSPVSFPTAPAVVGTPDLLFEFGVTTDGISRDIGAVYRPPSSCPTVTELAARADAKPTVVKVTEREVPFEGVTLDAPPAVATLNVSADQAWASARAASRPDPGPAPTIALATFADTSSGPRVAWVLVFRDAEVGPPSGGGSLPGQPTIPPKPCYLGTSVMAVDAANGVVLGLWSQGS